MDETPAQPGCFPFAKKNTMDVAEETNISAKGSVKSSSRRTGWPAAAKNKSASIQVTWIRTFK